MATKPFEEFQGRSLIFPPRTRKDCLSGEVCSVMPSALLSLRTSNDHDGHRAQVSLVDFGRLRRSSITTSACVVKGGQPSAILTAGLLADKHGSG
ncbi:hypothetical protein ColTof4_06964 [Colletotrichum tofieldiae]|nr:hypothetical protein ColTof3_11910 [Colletotrichum tofieldiae]GKT74541.1 hypothetical protein ColTof4_06964 [Colletotrichum tofieldiae]GKT91724.1 hypothetical protein Ct61P_09574 [Colletotrichum tofieldiae]